MDESVTEPRRKAWTKGNTARAIALLLMLAGLALIAQNLRLITNWLPSVQVATVSPADIAAPQATITQGAVRPTTIRPTQAPTATPTATPIFIGFAGPTADEVGPGGDGDGFESDAANAYLDDGLFAADEASGRSNSTSCTDQDKDSHHFYNFNLAALPDNNIVGVEVRLDARVASGRGPARLCVQLSSDGGQTWSEPKATDALRPQEQQIFLGSPTDNWGQYWDTTKISNDNFRLRITSVGSNNFRNYLLDWVAVRLYFGEPLELANGPHLLLDEYLIGGRQNVSRVVNAPQRHLNTPLISGLINDQGYHNYNFTASVLRDAETGRFRLWYSAIDITQDARFTAYLESADGLNWPLPYQVISGTHGESQITHVLDEGPDFVPAGERFKTIIPDDPNRAQAFGEALFSADGLHWTAYGNVTPDRYGEIWRPYFDPLYGRYGLLFRWNNAYSWEDAQRTTHENTVHDPDFTRLLAHATSPDFRSFSQAQLIYAPGSRDSGETQFYATSNVIRRGDLLITMLNVLRDDLKAGDTPAELIGPANTGRYPVYGVGYTVLAWSRDGEQWFRDRENNPFLQPAADSAAWDHAHAWIQSIVPVDDQNYLYYGGYQYGHKVYVDRSIGLLTMGRDRYVAQVASGEEAGILKTPLVTLNAAGIAINADAEGGRIRFQIEDPAGNPLPGFGFANCRIISTDVLDGPIACNGNWADLAGRPVRLVFQLQNASLFAFDLLSND